MYGTEMALCAGTKRILSSVSVQKRDSAPGQIRYCAQPEGVLCPARKHYKNVPRQDKKIEGTRPTQTTVLWPNTNAKAEAS